MIVVYLIAINLIAFGAMGLDKRFAEQRGRRISEATLLSLAVIGGSAGAIAGQQAFRHKTRKQPFATVLWMTPVLQAVVVGAWVLVAP